MQDTLIRGARLIDGTGAPWFRADLRISGGKIAAIGRDLPKDDARIIDAAERYLAPGFIDAHCHDDLVFLRQREREEKAHQGVTSIVVGNCSFSLYPATPASREDLRQHFSGLLGETKPEEIFDDLSGYRAALEGEGVALNVVSLVGHAALRLAVIGHDRRPATPEETQAMCALLDRQLAQGAAGLSLGLMYPPSAFAEADEMIALAKVVRNHGKVLAAHIRAYDSGLFDAMDEFAHIVGSAEVSGLLSHLQSTGRPNWGKIPAAIDKLEEFRAKGIDISFDMYPYPAGSTWILQLFPTAAMDGGLPALKARLKDPEKRAILERWINHGGTEFYGDSKVELIGWENIQLCAVETPELKRFEGQNMREAAAALGITPFDLMERFVFEEDGQTGIILFQLREDDLHAACCNRLFMCGSDGLPRPGAKPHPRAFGTFPRMAGPLRRDKHWFSLEEAVRKMTSVAAQRFSLSDRGLLRPGLAADLVLFDEAITDHATFSDSTLMPSGVAHLFVNGGEVIANGRTTGARPGKLL